MLSSWLRLFVDDCCRSGSDAPDGDAMMQHKDSLDEQKKKEFSKEMMAQIAAWNSTLLIWPL